MLVWRAQNRLMEHHNCSAQEALEALHAWAVSESLAEADVATAIMERSEHDDDDWLVEWLAVGVIMARRHLSAADASESLRHSAELESRSVVAMSKEIIRSNHDVGRQ